MSKTLSSQGGFSLLEMTIALCILGILSTFALPHVTQYWHHRAARMTKDNQERVVKSLECYLVQHNHLPHPDVFPTDNSASQATPQVLSENLIGIVPFYKLGLPEDIAKDGYGHFMTYIVAADACLFGSHTVPTSELDEHSVSFFCGKYDTNCDNFIDIKDEKDKSVLEKQDLSMADILSRAENIPNNTVSFRDHIVFALISHGADGAHKTGSLEEEINNQAAFRQHKITLRTQPYSINPRQLFRHRLVWGTKQEFAGFCKAEKINLASKTLKKTVEELEKSTQAMKSTADLMNKLKRLLPENTISSASNLTTQRSLGTNNAPKIDQSPINNGLNDQEIQPEEF